MARIILTEEQFDSFLIEEGMACVLEESFRGARNIEDLKKSVKRAIVKGVAIATIITALCRAGFSHDDSVKIANEVKTEMAQPDTLFDKKVEACEKYMKYALGNQGYKMEDTGLNPETLVKESDTNNFDLPFLMAVAHLESCFGANNRAKTTNSVFSVGSYDNGKNTVAYSDPNDSVAPYIRLIERDYLGDGKTLMGLLEPGSFVNYDGKRYASSKSYENNVKNIRNRILRMYPILGQS